MGSLTLEICLGLKTDSRHIFHVLVVIKASWSHHIIAMAYIVAADSDGTEDVHSVAHSGLSVLWNITAV